MHLIRLSKFFLKKPKKTPTKSISITKISHLTSSELGWLNWTKKQHLNSGYGPRGTASHVIGRGGGSWGTHAVVVLHVGIGVQVRVVLHAAVEVGRVVVVTRRRQVASGSRLRRDERVALVLAAAASAIVHVVVHATPQLRYYANQKRQYEAE